MALRSALDLDLFQRIRAAQNLPQSRSSCRITRHMIHAFLRLLILALSEYMYLTVENGFVSLTDKGEQVAENVVAFKQLCK